MRTLPVLFYYMVDVQHFRRFLGAYLPDNRSMNQQRHLKGVCACIYIYIYIYIYILIHLFIYKRFSTAFFLSPSYFDF